MDNKDIDYALVEETRPEAYTAMKYWGKKPHNIWKTYIETYTPNSGLFLDPFAGSAISAFEAVKAGRKAIAFDLNPMTTFFIEVFTSKYNREEFKQLTNTIIEFVENDPVYISQYRTKCERCGDDNAVIVNYKWESDSIYEVAIQCNNHEGRNGYRYVRTPSKDEIKGALSQKNINIDTWIPTDEFRDSISFSGSLIAGLGGNKFSDLWTRRNLYLLSKVFDKIKDIENSNLRLQALFSFAQTIHLTTKMCVPRNPGANRAFSTSWGRSAYLAANRQMEMNPLHVFKGSCFGKQSTDSALRSFKQYIGKTDIKTLYVSRANRSNRSTNFDIKYGIIDALTLSDYIDEKSVDFVITDPPYGGLVQYLDLSTIWLVWLKQVDEKYIPNYDAEITINNNSSIELYRSKFTQALRNVHKVLKDDGKIVFTFHNNQIAIWNSFLNSIMMAGFKIEKVIHQQNKRTGESNVANPYGTSGTDFYIRCVKSPRAVVNTDRGQFEHFVLTTAINIIAQRNEPTPFQILFNGLLAEISKAGFNIEDFDENIETFLSKHTQDIFVLTDNTTTKAGNYWWFKNPSEYIKYPDKMLTERVEDSILSLLRRKNAVTYDEVLADIYIRYPNGLTPNINSVVQILSKYANRSSDKWIYKGGEIEKEFTKHTEAIKKLIDIGKKLGFQSYVGKREQPEQYNGKILRQFADYTDLSILKFEKAIEQRVEMIDLVWLKEGKIEAIVEVENSTNFTSGIQRASNLDSSIPKLMVIPDYRDNEINNISDPLFVDSFKTHNWTYFKYTDVDRLLHMQKIGISNVLQAGRVLNGR
jgi:DNA modification methylase